MWCVVDHVQDSGVVSSVSPETALLYFEKNDDETVISGPSYMNCAAYLCPVHSCMYVFVKHVHTLR